VELELQTAVKEKSAAFTVRDIPTLSAIMDAHTNTKNQGLAVGNMLEVSNIEDDSFELVRKQVQYDVQVWRVWQNKVRTYESVRYHQKLQWAYQARQTNCRAAEAFMQANMQMILTENNVGQVLKEIHEFKKLIEKKLQLESEDVVAQRQQGDDRWGEGRCGEQSELKGATWGRSS
jgi:hypothetical protein